MNKQKEIYRYRILIIIASVLIPVVVALLIYMPEKINAGSDWIRFLPHLNGLVNTITSIILIAGFVFIKLKKVEYHRTAMSSAFFLGILFLVSYIIYHSTSASTIFGDVDGNGILEIGEAERIGPMRYIYLSILISHILLAVVVVPFVLFAFYFALTKQFDKHKKTVRITLPVWLYVSISGVIVYLMISPYYT